MKQIPIINHNPELSDTLVHLVQEHGYDAKEIYSAIEAVDILRKTKYPLILIDVFTYPGKDYEKDKGIEEANAKSNSPLESQIDIGIHLVERIKMPNSPNVKTPVIVYSTHNGDCKDFGKIEQRSLEAGANNYQKLMIGEDFYAFKELIDQYLSK